MWVCCNLRPRLLVSEGLKRNRLDTHDGNKYALCRTMKAQLTVIIGFSEVEVLWFYSSVGGVVTPNKDAGWRGRSSLATLYVTSHDNWTSTTCSED